MGIQEAKEQPWLNQGFGFVSINNRGKVMARWANGSYALETEADQFHAFVQAVHTATVRVAEVQAEADNFSRDEKAMFELLADWQQWALLKQRWHERMGLTV